MFWRFGGYANISTIDTILEKPDFTIEDLLDESDLIQELKQHNAKLIDYLRQDEVLKRLLEYVVAPKLEPVASPDNGDDQDDTKGKGLLRPFSRPRASSKESDADSEEEQERKRNRYAFVAAEVLSSDTWSIYEALMESQPLISDFWGFLKRPVPLDPLQASYFTKVNEALFDKKTDEMVALLRTLPEAVPDLLRHVECPMIMDLLLKIIALDRTEGGHGIVEWLYSQDVVPTLLSCLSPEHNWVVQTAAGDFIKAIITISANASQNDQQCIGPNELTRQLVSQECVEQLIQYMLSGGNSLTVGVGIVIEVIRKNNSDYDPDVGGEANAVPSSRDPIYLGTLLRLFARHVPDFVNLITLGPSQKRQINSTFGDQIKPLGFDRFKTCELMAELLHCSNMGLLNEVGSEELISSRDAERQKLRSEGRLSPNRGDEMPSEEDHAVSANQPCPEEGRKLEVTNISDDDGFEEVEPSREMNEDTSHEFVRAEDEIPTAPPPSSFIDKDDEDFVDEPLSSPRLNATEVKEEQFEDPDLVVAPLSPTKDKAAELAEKLEHSQDFAAQPESQPADEKKEVLPGEPEEVSAAQPQHDSSVDETTVEVRQLDLEDHPPAPSTDVSNTKAKETELPITLTSGASEHDAGSEGYSAARTVPGEKGEDAAWPGNVDNEAAPAPLFSKQTEPSELSEPGPEPPADNPLSPDSGTTAPDARAMANPQPETDEVGTADAPEIPQRPEPSTAEPVVGDYLKTQFVEYRVVPTILSFFFAYPWNNFLHNVVYDIVQQVFNGPMDRGYNPTLAVSLFEAADITNAIIKGQLVSDESQATMKTRMGYMGHLTLIAEEVVKFTERHPPELLSETVLQRVMDQKWMDYVEGALAETRERDNAILGGIRPEVAMGHRAGMSGNSLSSAGLAGLGSSFSGNSQNGGGSNALAEAGLNGSVDLQENNGSGGLGPFAISAGTLMSGFGSSSDEDEDDAEDNDEDVNNEFRAYTDPLNNSSSSDSMDPPSIPPPPPPPPPLNLPPSRARLQLAARLAMHQKNAAGESQDDQGDNEQSDPNNQSTDLRDPFADYEDDDADSDDEGDDSNLGTGQSTGLTGSWGTSGRGSWWRGVVRRDRRENERSDALNDSDSDKEDNGDEDFGDFAIPETEPASSADPHGEDLLRPLAVHPGFDASKPQQKTSLSGLWPFGSKDGEEKKKNGVEEAEGGENTASGRADQADAAAASYAAHEGGEEGKVQPAVEAKRRTSIEDPDEEEVRMEQSTMG